MLFCLPAAGVLVLELLRQARSGTTNSSAFSRSGVIQNLSILTSTLEWIARPGIGNYELCRQARSMLKRSLDRILDPSLLASDRAHGEWQPYKSTVFTPYSPTVSFSADRGTTSTCLPKAPRPYLHIRSSANAVPTNTHSSQAPRRPAHPTPQHRQQKANSPTPSPWRTAFSIGRPSSGFRRIRVWSSGPTWRTIV